MKSAVPTLALGGVLTLFLFGCSSKIEVPPVTGLDLGTATARLQEKGFTLGPTTSELGAPETPPGSVLRQTPAAGQQARAGSPVQLTVDDSLFVPSFNGLDLASAQSLAQSQHLQVARLEKRFTGRSSLNAVIAQSPAPNTRVPANSAVVLTVEDHVVMPNLLGLTPDDAHAQLQQAGLRLGAVKPLKAPADAIVAAHTPKAGDPVAAGSSVDLKLATSVAQTDSSPEVLVEKGRDLIEGTQIKIKEGSKAADGVKETINTLRDIFGGGSGGTKKKKQGGSESTGSQETRGQEPRPSTSSLSAISLTPPSPATLGDRQPVRVSFRYATEERHGVIITAIPQRSGQPLPHLSGITSRTFTAAAGEGTLEVAVAPAGALADAIRLEMRAAQDHSRLLCESRVPFRYQFGTLPRTARKEELPGKLRGFPLADQPDNRGVRVP